MGLDRVLRNSMAYRRSKGVQHIVLPLGGSELADVSKDIFHLNGIDGSMI
jgi:hypothetical protein